MGRVNIPSKSQNGLIRFLKDIYFYFMFLPIFPKDLDGNKKKVEEVFMNKEFHRMKAYFLLPFLIVVIPI